MVNDLIANDVSRCHGNGSPDCAQCLRRLQIEIDAEGNLRRLMLASSDWPWPPFVEPAATATGCTNLLRGRNQ